MLDFHRALALIGALLLTVFSSQSVLAEDTQNLVWVDATDEDGLVTHVPTVNTVKLGDRIRMLRSALAERKNELVKLMNDKKLGVKDAVITAIMPGGLLYAGYRKREHAQAKNNLAEVSAEIAEFTSDLAALDSAIAIVAVAQIP